MDGHELDIVCCKSQVTSLTIWKHMYQDHVKKVSVRITFELSFDTVWIGLHIHAGR